MARLPQPGSDENTWGTILNDYLSTSHTSSGELKPNIVGNDQLADNAVNAAIIADDSIIEANLAPAVRTKLNMTAGTPALDDISDVTITSAANGQALTYQSGVWVNGTVSGGVTDHGALTGLGDDDHTQYLNNARGDARYYSQAAMDTALAGKAATTHTHTASQISDSTTTGRSVLTAADAAAARTAIGAGTSNLVIGTTSTTAKAGDYAPTKTDVGLGNVDNTSDATKNAAVATLTNKTISGASNTLSNIPESAVTNLTTDLAGKQASNGDLSAIAALTPVNDDVIQRKAGAWTNRTMVQLKTDLALAKADVGLGNVDNTSDATKNSATATFTNKTISGASNTLSNIPESAVTSLTSDLAAKAPLASPTFTGKVTTPALQVTTGAGTANQVLTSDVSGNATWAAPPSAPVTSVNTYTGAVVLVKGDVGLGNVDNTSDATKNAATATLTNKTISGASNTLSNIPESAVTNLTTDLAGKAATTHTHTASQISDSTTVGRSVLVATDATAARTAIGAGTSSLVIGTTSTTAKAGDYVPTKADVGLGNVDNTSDATQNAATATLTNKTISGASNTFSSIPQSAVTNLTTTYIARVLYDTTNSVWPTRPSVTYVEWVGSVDPGVLAVNGDTWVDTST
jgi:hypothetical protein